MSSGEESDGARPLRRKRHLDENPDDFATGKWSLDELATLPTFVEQAEQQAQDATELWVNLQAVASMACVVSPPWEQPHRAVPRSRC